MIELQDKISIGIKRHTDEPLKIESDASNRDTLAVLLQSLRYIIIDIEDELETDFSVNHLTAVLELLDDPHNQLIKPSLGIRLKRLSGGKLEIVSDADARDTLLALIESIQESVNELELTSGDEVSDTQYIQLLETVIQQKNKLTESHHITRDGESRLKFMPKSH